MDRLAYRVRQSYFKQAKADKGEQQLVQFQRSVEKAAKIIDLLPRLFKTYGRQTHGYKTSDPVKATATAKKILAKVEDIGKEYAKAFELVEAWGKDYQPTTEEKKQSYDEFQKWLGKMDTSLAALRKAIRETNPELPYYDIHLGKFNPSDNWRPSEHLVLAVQAATTNIDFAWKMLLRPDPDPVLIPKDGSDYERFMAFVTPSIKRLAKGAASKLKKDQGAAAVCVFRTMENVNAHKESNVAEAILSPLVDEDAITEKMMSSINDVMLLVSGDIDYGIVESGAFGVALMQAVGAGAYAEKLAQALAKEFAEFTTA